MARPSVKEKRTEEILQAYEHCIALYGVEGATLQKIAEVAGIARPLLRHHVGNSDELLKLALKRFIERSDAMTKAAFDALPSPCDGESFVNFLFEPMPYEDQPNDTMIAAAFIYAAQTHPEIKEQMQSWLMAYSNSLSAEFQKLYPDADTDKISHVTAGIMGIYFNVESLEPLGSNDDLRNHSRLAALYLLKILD
jgi:AcrR family transcriptional regulator